MGWLFKQGVSLRKNSKLWIRLKQLSGYGLDVQTEFLFQVRMFAGYRLSVQTGKF